jgi:hypothetical protein
VQASHSSEGKTSLRTPLRRDYINLGVAMTSVAALFLATVDRDEPDVTQIPGDTAIQLEQIS